jgi:F420-0:gamma-glutamyl ligase
MRWGVTGMSLAHSGFGALKNYIGEKDLFGREFKFEKLNIADSLAASAVLVMGEGSEQTPLAIIEDLPQVEFLERNPTNEELKELKINIEDDLYAPLLKSVMWRKGNK